MKIYQKVFFSIINDLDFLTGFDLNNSKNSVELLNWLISNFVNTLHDNKIYISEISSTPINIQNENIYFYLEISTKKLSTNKKVYICFYKNLDSIDKLNFINCFLFCMISISSSFSFIISFLIVSLSFKSMLNLSLIISCNIK
jgi:hypothetical protein